MTTQGRVTIQALGDERWQMLADARASYDRTVSTHYDEVLQEVAERAQGTGSLGKADVGALLRWKRLRADTPWVSALMALPDRQVREHTAVAITAVRDETVPVPDAASNGRRALSPLPGFQSGDALASALLLAAAPLRMAVYDKRVQHALVNRLGLTLTAAPGRYGRYMRLVGDLQQVAAGHGERWTARDVDVALFELGRPGGPAAARPGRTR